MSIFSYDSILMRFLNFVADMVLLHFLWLLCSLPVITMGASTTALYYTCMKRIRTKEGYITRNFFHSFKMNLKQSTVIWLILLIIGYLFYLDFQIASSVEGYMGKIMLGGCIIFLVPCLFIALYIFPVQAKFKNSIKNNFKNAFLMSYRHFIMTMILLFIVGSIVILSFFFPPMIGLLLICGGGLTGFLTSTIFIQVFRHYIPNEAEKDLEISGEKFELNS
ncbi:Uncharacterized membrane protein YesL [Anaerocolumna jejuensis DSM 15929]|uniref:Uncharacterized membrane protein YesL n=1 Tax=Anaerocolumna jejuensis DSM 15929 TaxID=1121322 RepID=A0A1M6R4L0_9FIRM|nr:YesL family protein [Anaerocolumna jejuensis]SHK27278.1 Uncharacterized membrane protein YesL [Anaerocolumna jejuensis DSM 15929]